MIPDVTSIISEYTTFTSVVASMATGLLALYPYLSYRKSIPVKEPIRPPLVLDAISNGTPLYYFGVGSNLSRSHLENRSSSGKIEIMSMEPCYIPGYRLAFNMRGLPPMEPAMGSLEPVHVPATNQSTGTSASTKTAADEILSTPLKAYEKTECHGSLIQLSPEDYDKVYKSEGGGRGAYQGYEEIVVTCIPYDKSKSPVQAVGFRVRNHARLVKDAPPSKRYMTIIQDGAKELGLKSCYQKWLEEHPIQKPCSKPMKKIAVNSIFFHFFSMFAFKTRFPSFVQGRLLYILYGSTEAHWTIEVVREAIACMIIFPTACCGFVVRCLLDAAGKTPPQLKTFIEKME